MTCPQCSAEFEQNPHRPWQRFCSEPCRRRGRRRERRDERRKAKQPIPRRLCAQCAGEYQPIQPAQKFCGDSCRNRAHCAKQKAIARPRFRRLKCHFCRGRHVSAACPNRYGESVKLYGTMGPNREYVPPPGVRVRVLVLPNTVHGDMLKDYANGGTR